MCACRNYILVNIVFEFLSFTNDWYVLGQSTPEACMSAEMSPISRLFVYCKLSLNLGSNAVSRSNYSYSLSCGYNESILAESFSPYYFFNRSSTSKKPPVVQWHSQSSSSLYALNILFIYKIKSQASEYFSKSKVIARRLSSIDSLNPWSSSSAITRFYTYIFPPFAIMCLFC